MGTLKFEAVPATQELIDEIKPRLREADLQEIRALGVDPQQALQESFVSSSKCWVGLYYGKPALACGVSPVSLLGSKGIVWLLGTEDVEKIPCHIIRRSRAYVNEMAKDFDVLENYVDARNEVSKKWLTWCGFTMDEARPYGVKGELFHRFYLERVSGLSILKNAALTKGTFREKIMALQNVISAMPGAYNDTDEICPVSHHFADGMYCREMFIPKGVLLVGKIHKHEHPSFIMSGDISVFSEEGLQRIKGPAAVISKPGVKRIGYAHEDTVWITVHRTDETNLERIEEDVIAKTFEDYDAFLLEQQGEKLLCHGE